jgi:hypothetical protein
MRGTSAKVSSLIGQIGALESRRSSFIQNPSVIDRGVVIYDTPENRSRLVELKKYLKEQSFELDELARQVKQAAQDVLDYKKTSIDPLLESYSSSDEIVQTLEALSDLPFLEDESKDAKTESVQQRKELAVELNKKKAVLQAKIDAHAKLKAVFIQERDKYNALLDEALFIENGLIIASRLSQENSSFDEDLTRVNKKASGEEERQFLLSKIEERRYDATQEAKKTREAEGKRRSLIQKSTNG